MIEAGATMSAIARSLRKVILFSGGKNAVLVFDQTSRGVIDITTMYQNGMITARQSNARTSRTVP